MIPVGLIQRSVAAEAAPLEIMEAKLFPAFSMLEMRHAKRLSGK